MGDVGRAYLLLLNLPGLPAHLQNAHIPAIALRSCFVGFALTWLYVLVRPRLGPGPKTSFLVAAISLIFVNQTIIDAQAITHPISRFQIYFFGDSRLNLASPGWQIVLQWLTYSAATCLAGWQYIENS